MSGKVENKSTTYDKDGNGVKADKTIYSESKKDKISKLARMLTTTIMKSHGK